jgi:thiamine-phosphate pyrophosphorylase
MKDATAKEALPIAQEVREVCSRSAVPFVLAHFIDLAEPLNPTAVLADAIHLGGGDNVRLFDKYPDLKQFPWGWSSHSLRESRSIILDAEPAYLFHGPIFDTPSKRPFGPPLGTEEVTKASELPARTSLVFIGGMNAKTIPLAVAAGARRVAAISALLSVPDPRAAAAELKTLLPAVE